MADKWMLILLCYALVLPCHCGSRRDPYDIHDYKNHPCIRKCQAGVAPMTCRYYFLVEHFTTLSAACYDCPGKGEHCSLPHCIPGNGLVRPVLAVNRMVPGPAIHVCKGDIVEVLVDNRMELGEGITIHWHGIHQRGTPYMDGTSMVTQCPITKWTKMTYRFEADEAGTSFWHSHSALQRSDGLFGGLIIREPPISDPQSALYDLDLTDHIIILNDWAKSTSVDSIVNLFHKGGSVHPSGILVNGRGRADGGLEIPYPEFRVVGGLRYRFRVIYSGIINCPIYVRVDDHRLLMIASDGKDFKPVEVDSFTIYSGERYDFVLHAKDQSEAKNSSYWIRFKGHNSCSSSKTIQAAVLRYDLGGTDDPPGEVSYDETVPRDDEVTLSDRSGVSSNKNYQITDLKSLGADEKEPDLIDTPDKQFYISLVRSTQPDKRFMTPRNPDCLSWKRYSTESNSTKMAVSPTSSEDMIGDRCNPTKRYNLQLNYITGRLPPAPPLTQYDDINKKLLCNGDNIMSDCTKVRCDCVHTLSFDTDDLVEIVLVSPRTTRTEAEQYQLIHPMHIHGYSARVVAMMRLGENVTVESVKAMDLAGNISRVRSHAPYKDTIPVGDHSVVILRLRADNPGFWFFHCHIELHAELGMALILQSGNVSEMPQPGEAFPKCSTWIIDDDVKSNILYSHEEEDQFVEELSMTYEEDKPGTGVGEVLVTHEKRIGDEENYEEIREVNAITTPTMATIDSTNHPDDTTSKRPFITGQSVWIIVVASLISMVLPAVLLAVLLWYRRRRQDKQFRTPYKLLTASAHGDACHYHSTRTTRTSAPLPVRPFPRGLVDNESDTSEMSFS